jgi:antitoxin component of MazEF toxin-antitoxin module
MYSLTITNEKEDLLQAVKARHQGNATVVTLPAALKIPEGKEFFVFLNDDESITLVPKIANVFAEAARAGCTLWQSEEWDDVEPAGREVI